MSSTTDSPNSLGKKKLMHNSLATAKIRRLGIGLASVAALGLSACASSDSGSVSGSGTGNECVAGKTVDTAGKLTIATGTPAFEPWVVGDAPESGEGFEAAIAYAVANELGFSNENVVWIRTGFDEAIQPGAKNFDFNLQQYSITDERKATVDFSAPYYSTNQAIVGFADSPAAGATKVSELKELKFGAQSGTTSLDFILNIIKPTSEPFVYDDNAGAKAALEAKQIDAIIVDLPTAFYISAVEIEGSKVIGQFPLSSAVAADNFGLLLDKANPLTECVNTALTSLKADGTLTEIEKTWLADKTDAPVISLD